MKNWYGELTPEMRRKYYRFLLEHRLNPGSIYSHTPSPAKEDISYCIEGGMNYFNLAYIHLKKDQERADLMSTLRDYEAYLKANGWWEKAYVYGFDEIQPPLYHQLKEMFGLIGREFPGLKRMCTVIPKEELDEYVDIWVPLTNDFDREVADEYESRGDEVWWYTCCVPGHPYANWFIDYTAIEPRLLFWMNWKYKVPGYLYYALNMWQSNYQVEGVRDYIRPHEDLADRDAIKAGKRWPEVPWNTFSFGTYNGDGLLIYPGKNGPLSSVRLECIRDGIEDYECFYALNELVKEAEESGVNPKLAAKARKLLEVDEKAVKSVTSFTYDPKVLLRAREELFDTIEKLSRGLAKARH